MSRLAGAFDAARVLAGGRLRTAGAVVLAYHDVSDDPANTTDYVVTPRRLAAQITAARGWGLRFVDLGELTRRFLAGEAVDGLASVVFDDSLVGVHHLALPILGDLGVPATVFAVSAALGESPAWWPGAARVMTRAELAEVIDAGVTVGSHTRTHPSLVGLAANRLTDETAGARAELEDLAGRPIELFAYPGGDADPSAIDAVSDAGYIAAFSFRNGRMVTGRDRLWLPRLNMHAGQHRARLAYHLARSPESWPDGP